MGTKTVFEHNDCGKCGGSGRIAAFSHVYAGVCFRCNGAGYKLTRHGKKDHEAWRAAFDAVCLKTVADVKVGDRVRMTGSNRYAIVTEVKPVEKIYGTTDQATGETVWHDGIELTYDRKVVDTAIASCAPHAAVSSGVCCPADTKIYISQGDANPSPAAFVTEKKVRKSRKEA